MAEFIAVEVRLWDEMVGAVAAAPGKPGYFEFQYSPAFAQSGLEISPFHMQLGRRRFSFPALNQETFHGLPGMLADSLPDKFGNALIDEYMARHGMRTKDVTSLQRLVYVGRRAMGALGFEPAMTRNAGPEVGMPLDMAHLVEDARRALRGEFAIVAPDILDIGSSAGGARAKAVVGWKRATNEIVSGQFDVPAGFEHWLLKFDVGIDGVLGYSAGFGRIEYAHYLMATEAGVEMSESHLLEENGRAHFMTRRFDRRDNRKLHVQTLCGLRHLDFNMPCVHSYEQYLRTALDLRLGAPAIEQAWMRCAFNVAAVNCDDHTKNLAFMMDETGKWDLAPAYDMCFSHNPAAEKWTRQHQMLVAGKAWDITRNDLLALAGRFDVRRAAEKLDRILDAVNRWPEFGKQTGVPAGEIRRIAAFHPF